MGTHSERMVCMAALNYSNLKGRGHRKTDKYRKKWAEFPVNMVAWGSVLSSNKYFVLFSKPVEQFDSY